MRQSKRSKITGGVKLILEIQSLDSIIRAGHVMSERAQGDLNPRRRRLRIDVGSAWPQLTQRDEWRIENVSVIQTGGLLILTTVTVVHDKTPGAGSFYLLL